MACPYFMPTTKCEEGGWIHPARLPLGTGWQGHCAAPGHEGLKPTDSELREFCNLGYASGCSRLPRDRAADAVRFSVTRDYGNQLTVCFVRECSHRPAGHGILEYDLILGGWTSLHADPCVQRMADCYLQSYLARRKSASVMSSSPHS